MARQMTDKGLRAEISVTPLLGVMLVMLMVFMVVTPMLQRGKAVPLPVVPAPEKQRDNGKDIVVSVEYGGSGAKDYKLYLGQFLVDKAALRSRLENELRREPTREVYLKGDSRLTYGAVREVMQICHEAGLGQVQLATTQSQGAGEAKPRGAP